MRDIASRVLWSGAILLAVGLSIILLVGEWFAAFDACLANPDCHASGSVATLEGFLALMVGGATLAVSGLLIALTELPARPAMSPRAHT
jgi:hypothetical protein